MSKTAFGTYVCDDKCKPKWEKGKGSFSGYRLLICKKHQIIHRMQKIEKEE